VDKNRTTPPKSLLFGGARRVPLILQTEAAECGVACLAMIASAHGLAIDLPAARDKLSVSLKGMNMAQLMECAQALDLTGRPVRLDLHELKELQLPCILHWDMNHFVVLKSANATRAVVLDPAVGERKFTLAQLSKHFTGVALELSPNPGFTPREEKQRVALRQLIGRVVGIKRQMLQVFSISLGLQLCMLVSPLYVQWVVDHALTSGDKDLITLLSIGFLLLVFVQVGIGALRSLVVLRMGTEVGVQWSINVFAHLLRLPQAYFEKRHLGDVVSRFGSVDSIQHTLTTSFIEGVIDSILALLTLGLMWMYSPLLSLIVLLSVFIYALLRISAYPALRRATEEQIVLGAKEQSNFLESVRGIQAIKLFARENQRQALWHNHMIDSTNRVIKTQRFMLGFELAEGLLSGIANVAVIWLGAHLILSNTFSIGMLFAFVTYKGVFTTRMMGLVDKGIEVKMLGLQTERLADIVLTPKETNSGKTSGLGTGRAIALTPAEALPPGSLRLEDVSFRYSELDPYVLKDVTLELAAGQSIAIVGPSGCGKTTLAKLVLGLLHPSGGRILKGHTDIATVHLSAWRSRVNAVMQDDQLFAGSIADNITFFDDSPIPERLEHVARLACIHDDIEKMSMGYNTLVGDMGTALSGGQKQRILLARALYGEPEVLVLDEATSHLDVALEKAINQAIQSLTITRIVIAHRPETIVACDVVLNLPDFNRVKI
jgi:ATP-binding cassette subfamily B protein RaxB